MLLLSYNATNEIVCTNNVNHDTTLPYTIVFKGLADNKEYQLTGVANISASPFRFLEFSINIPNDIKLNTSQYYRVIVTSGDGKVVADEIAVFLPVRNDTIYNDSNNTTRKFYE